MTVVALNTIQHESTLCYTPCSEYILWHKPSNHADSDQELKVMVMPYIRIEKNVITVIFHHAMVVGAGWTGLSI